MRGYSRPEDDIPALKIGDKARGSIPASGLAKKSRGARAL